MLEVAAVAAEEAVVVAAGGAPPGEGTAWHFVNATKLRCSSKSTAKTRRRLRQPRPHTHRDLLGRGTDVGDNRLRLRVLLGKLRWRLVHIAPSEKALTKLRDSAVANSNTKKIPAG